MVDNDTIEAEFEIEDNPDIEADFSIENDPDIEADFSIDVGVQIHGDLVGRDEPDQHPIESITGLRDILDKLWTYEYEQATASDTWIIKHNLGRKPSVVVVDSAGTVFYPEVIYDDENQCTVKINGATSGKAYLN